MTRTLYLQCDSGVSGDMMVGALLDLGASESGLRQALSSVDLAGYDVRVTRKLAGALEGCDFDVIMEEGYENHDHDMQWLFGEVGDVPSDHDHGHDHHHGHGHDHDHHHHDHGHDHGKHGHHHHEHRGLSDVERIVNESGLSERVRDMVMRVFRILGEAEAKAHGATPEEVHFHEVGAVDSIVDVVAACWCMDDLGVDRVVTSPLAEGEGHVRSAHGILPIPVPAVANIVESHGLVLKRAHRKGELVTPTGAALVAAFAEDSALPECYRIVATGMGTGKRAYDPPSTLRAQLLDEVAEGSGANEGPAGPDLWKLETEVDDCTGEALGFVIDRMYALGAREAHFIPVFMKKGRPGYQIEVLCDEELIPAIEEALFEDTTTIGIRRSPLWRHVLDREELLLDTELGKVRAKRVTLPNGRRRTYLEHDSVAEVACRQEMGYQDVVRLLSGQIDRETSSSGDTNDQ